MADNFSGKTRRMTASHISDLDGSKIMRGLLIGLAISIVFWAALAYFLL
jgi:type III secretory pathway component EscT